MTMEQLAAQLGVSFQQVQKYERGSNKISFERLYSLSVLFEAPLSVWLEEDDPQPIAPAREERERQALGLIKAYHAIGEAEHRALVCAMARALAGQSARVE